VEAILPSDELTVRVTEGEKLVQPGRFDLLASHASIYNGPSNIVPKYIATDIAFGHARAIKRRSATTTKENGE